MAYLAVNKEKLIEEFEHYDYVRCTFSDLHGTTRGLDIRATYGKSFVEDGLGVYMGTIAMGPENEIPLALDFIEEGGNKNIFVRPVVNNIAPLPWASEPDLRVGEIICETVSPDGETQGACPRHVAWKQQQKLKALGLEIYSAYECESMIKDTKLNKPVTTGSDFACMYSMMKYEKKLLRFDQQMAKTGIDLEYIHPEYAPGQIEYVFKPNYGLESPDVLYRFKQGLKELCFKNDLEVTFMTRPYAGDGCSNGTHLNFSIFDKDGRNIFHDASAPNKLSKQCLYFVGGLLKHLKAMTAISSPSWNCYRRLHQPWAPSFCDWGIDDRRRSIRVKNFSPKATYIENRLPSGSSEPYLVFAATLAAGIDGLVNEILPPEPGPSSDQLPHTLDEAIEELKKDQVLIDALGSEFVEWYISCKENFDIKKFKNHKIGDEDEKNYQRERKAYYEFH